MTRQREGDTMPGVKTKKMRGPAMKLKGMRIELVSTHKSLEVVVDDKLW